MKQYYVYIMSSANRAIYIGMTNNLERRVYEHKNKLYEGHTAKYNITNLVYFEETNEVVAVIEQEKYLKNLHRTQKLALIQTMNPKWEDLSREWFE